MRARPARPRLFTHALLLAFVILSSDLATKWYVEHLLAETGPMIEIAPFFNLVLNWNRGVSFGLLYNHHDMMPAALTAVAGLITCALLAWLWRAEQRLLAFGLGLTVGGALGNIADRVRFGAVRDFLDFHAFGWHWPAFNVADSAVVIGVCLILLDGLARRPDNR